MACSETALRVELIAFVRNKKLLDMVGFDETLKTMLLYVQFAGILSENIYTKSCGYTVG
jgi:hypothetical protein